MAEFETLNMKSVTIETGLRLIEEQLEDNDLKPVMLIGKSGIGKTQAIHSLSQELGIGFVELRLVTMTETDIVGVPTVVDGRTVYNPNDLLPKVSRDGETGILVLDELPSASRGVRASIYQLMDDRKISSYALPEGWLIVAMGNGPDDGGVWNGLEHATISKCNCVRVEPDLSVWCDWAVKNDINPAVIGYLQCMTDKLHIMDPESEAGVFPCPRSWVALSRKLNDRERRVKNNVLDKTSVEIYAASAVGMEVASSFSAFYRYKEKMVDVIGVLDNGEVDMTKIERQTAYLSIHAMAGELRRRLTINPNDIRSMDNVVEWVVNLQKVANLDLAISALSEMGKIEEFADYTIDANNEKLDDFMVKNGAIFSANR